MRIALVGKFPPIQGGVSMRTYWTAHQLAMRGHDVQVITNAKEAEKPFRMHMRAEDWERCEADYGSGGVKVHWTEPPDPSQHYTPMASPFVSKLAASAARLHAERPFDVILSYYLEPYGVAGHLLAGITGVPHVVRMAGSDAGRLWQHPQFELLYDHILRSADYVIAAGSVAERAKARGVAPDRIVFGGGFAVPEEIFSPDGPVLDPLACRDEVGPDLRTLVWGDFSGRLPYFGVFGKLGESKGSFALLAALETLRHSGLDVGLVALAHGRNDVERRFRSEARRRGLADRILQLPFVPHRRIAEFVRGCLAVCCLEQDFPIAFHQPIVAREVLLSGTCLVASAEMIRKLPGHGRLPHGYGCVAIRDVNDVEELSARLAAIVKRPDLAAKMGARGRAFALALQRDTAFPDRIEQILLAAAERRSLAPVGNKGSTVDAPLDRFHFSQIAANAIAKDRRIDSVEAARAVLAAVQQRTGTANPDFERLLPAMEIEVALAAGESEADASVSEGIDPIFRLYPREWAMDTGELGFLRPVRDPNMRIVAIGCDASRYVHARTLADLPPTRKGGRSHIVVFGASHCERRTPLVVDERTASLLQLSDGSRSAAEIVAEVWPEDGLAEDKLAWIESLFLYGVISLLQAPGGDGRPHRGFAHPAGVRTQLAPLIGGSGSGPAGTPASCRPSRSRKRSQSLS